MVDKIVKKKRIRKKKPKDPNVKLIPLDPRRNAFIDSYTNPLSPTYCNALQSAMRSGYTREYAKTILFQRPAWLSEAISKQERIEKALRNIDQDLDIDPLVPAMGAFGPVLDKETKQPVMVLNPKLIERRQAATALVLKATHPDYRQQDRSKDQPPPNNSQITQIIIMAPDGKQNPNNQTVTETIRSLPEAS